MELRELFEKINQSIDELDLVYARRLIEENIEIVKDKKHFLSRNARELVDVLMEANLSSLNRKEMLVVQTINAYASSFDLRGLKLTLKNHTELLFKNDIFHYLNSDAKIVLEGMGVIMKQ
ncbi:hypothetical protein ACFFF5_00135 [Lederbergia wuyishanensis]|uniref:Uncharacterized protein n=1 Tax=Lederbergia wuyishanensis TaxID=1347903 RepID=A0ABU0D1X6_9BACI|nr:hypothetical protein [Lederbergia wuyishanensis]MCJ8007016.1 hypothetical protein [Lederbergia wuyishanensis]MDQ0342400.1 hypothetical protein [Lederbergia wuyishanensis]